MADKAQIQEAIKVQGEVVRKLKSEKASKEQVSISVRCAVCELLACGEQHVMLDWNRAGMLASQRYRYIN